MTQAYGYYHHFVKQQAALGRLVVQPRMGFSALAEMRRGLEAVKLSGVPAIGTITLDSFTRTRDFASARRAVETGTALNGYPIVSYTTAENRQLVAGLQGPEFPVQVRHGSPLPVEIFEAALAAGIDAIEGGPVSYCFPYSRVPLKDSFDAWSRCSSLVAEAGPLHHIESFGGCMMGQLCPPSLLMAITIAEALFFVQHGVGSYSISLAQGTHAGQDVAALKAMRRLGLKYLGPQEQWHIVFYTFMGKYAETYAGARALMEESARIAAAGGAERLIVKTVKEAHEIPSVQDNINALQWSWKASQEAGLLQLDAAAVAQDEALIFEEADFLLQLLLNEHPQLDVAMQRLFEKGWWDVPYCLHPGNAGLTHACITADGYIYWAEPGRIPFPPSVWQHHAGHKKQFSSAALLRMLSFNSNRFDAPARVAAGAGCTVNPVV